MKSCELCKSPARLYCESDQASLCWNCDSKIHSANFLVARHSRTLLCHACQSPTPWSASGSKLNPTASVCWTCVSDGAGGLGQEQMVGVPREEREGGGEVCDEIGGEDQLSFDGDGEDEDDDDDEEASDSEDDEDNQVVPWSSSSLPPPPPPPASSTSSSCSDDHSMIQRWGATGCESPISVPFKRAREIRSDLQFQDDRVRRRARREGDCESEDGAAVGDSNSVEGGSVLKGHRIEPFALNRPDGDRAASIMDSLGVIQRGIT